MQGKAIVVQHICPQKPRSSFTNSSHQSDQQRCTYTSSLPLVFDQDADIGRVVAQMQIAETYAVLTAPCNVGVPRSGRRQYLATVEGAVRHAVKATIETPRRAAPKHGKQGFCIAMLERCDPHSMRHHGVLTEGGMFWLM